MDIARLTTHNIESVSRYIKTYKDVLFMLEKGFNVMEMVRVTGRGRSTILQYRKLAYLYHPGLIRLELLKIVRLVRIQLTEVQKWPIIYLSQ